MPFWLKSSRGDAHDDVGFRAGVRGVWRIWRCPLLKPRMLRQRFVAQYDYGPIFTAVLFLADGSAGGVGSVCLRGGCNNPRHVGSRVLQHDCDF